MSNIFANLELPVNVVIDFDLVPEPLPTKAARRIEEQEACQEVARAIQVWCYETYC